MRFEQRTLNPEWNNTDLHSGACDQMKGALRGP
jgi:hypothetical protein